jgi:hypothetical protein
MPVVMANSSIGFALQFIFDKAVPEVRIALILVWLFSLA